MAGRAAWVIVGLLWVVAVLNYLDRQLLVNMAAPIKSDLVIADTPFGLFSSVFLWTYGICSPFAGYLADRVGRKPVIIASLGIGFLLAFLTRWLVNAILLKVTDAVSDTLDIENFRTALVGAFLISIFGTAGQWLVRVIFS